MIKMKLIINYLTHSVEIIVIFNMCLLSSLLFTVILADNSINSIENIHQILATNLLVNK